MMLTITDGDFRKLSDSCQRELLQLLGYAGTNEDGEDNETIPYEDSTLHVAEDYSPDFALHEASSVAKRVIDITPEQAKELIANISEKSIETLKRFTVGEPIALDDLFGEGKPYSNLSDLKRSFVGAVNRRLRTVTGNRQAVLFLTVKTNTTKIGTQISVRQATATSLSHALALTGNVKLKA